MSIFKKKGFIAIPIALLAIAYISLAGTLVTLYSQQFSMIKSGRTAYQAQQYAEIDANTLQLLSYDDLDSSGAHTRKTITSVTDADGWQDEITIGSETVVNSDSENKQRIATIKIYKEGDTLARYSLQVPLSSKGSSSLPKGSIIPWYGDINNIPTGFKLCDGNNNTPDLRDKFLVGAGNLYTLNDIGGNSTTKLTTANLPQNAFSELFNGYYITGIETANEDAKHTNSMQWGKQGEINHYFGFYGTNAFMWFSSFSSAIKLNGWYGSEFENRPPYYALYYMMKV